MPTICKKDTCRNKAVYGFLFGKPLFCSLHREFGSKNVRMIDPSLVQPAVESESQCRLCACPDVFPRFKGFCKRCYVKTYPFDPLSLQSLYKSKDDIIQKFIDSKFDGFIHKNSVSEIHINGAILQIVYSDDAVSTEDGKNIVIRFNPNKYANGKNPMLYKRLPDLEKEIARQFERIISEKSSLQ